MKKKRTKSNKNESITCFAILTIKGKDSFVRSNPRKEGGRNKRRKLFARAKGKE